jgi:malate permease and related proteins
LVKLVCSDILLKDLWGECFVGNVNSQFILSMLIIVLGYVSKRINIIKETDGEGISRIIFNFTLPALVIATFSSIKVDGSLFLLPIINMLFCSAMILIALYLFRNESRVRRGMMCMTAAGFNIGLFAYPLVESLWGQEGLKYFGMFDMGNAVIVFGVCYFAASYFSTDEGTVDFKAMLKKITGSIPLITYVITLLINVSGLKYPGIIIDISKVLSRANMPLSLLLLGVYLSFSFEKSYWKGMGKVLGLRYGIGLTVGALLYFLLPFEPLFRYTALIGIVLPISMTVIPYSVQFNYDHKFVGTLNNFSIIISFILVWIIGLAVS